MHDEGLSVEPGTDEISGDCDVTRDASMQQEHLDRYSRYSHQCLTHEILTVWAIVLGFALAYGCCYYFNVSYGTFLHAKILYAVFVACNIFAAGQAFYSWAVLVNKSVARDFMFFLCISFIGAAAGNSIDYVIWVGEMTGFKQSMFTNLIFVFSMLLAFPGIHFLGQVCRVRFNKQPILYYLIFIAVYAMIPALMNIEKLKELITAEQFSQIAKIQNIKEFLFGILYSMTGGYLASMSLYIWQTGHGRLVQSARLVALGMVALSFGCAIYAGLFPQMPSLQIAANPVNLIIAIGYVLTSLGVRRAGFTIRMLSAFDSHRLPPAAALMEIFGESEGISVYKRLEKNIRSTLLELMKSREETQLKKEEISELEHEINRRKKIEQELILAKREAEELSEAKSQFLAMMSHELKTPLTAIKGYSALLKGKTLQTLLESGKVSEISTQIEANSDYLNEMVNSLLEFSQLENGTFSYQNERFRIEEILPYLRSICSTHSRIAGCGFVEKIESGDLIIEGDRQAVQQIISNLLVNAFKFCAGTDVRLFIGSNGSDLIIRVNDSGIGIAQDEQEKIFDAFYQVSLGKKRKFGGIGLGLSIVKKVVCDLNGKISVKSNLDQGAEFEVVLPICVR